jgi:galactose mutarotase-like enzyme
MTDLISIEQDKLRALINPKNGQLVSLSLDELEFFHNGASPGWDGQGWSNSEIVAYPVFGPVNNYSVRLGDKRYILDQHGISRNIPFVLHKKGESFVSLVQSYHGEAVPNSKYKPGNNHPENLIWIPYELTKKFQLEDGRLVCELTVKNVSEKKMLYVIGWHPAFKVLGDISDGIFLDDKGNSLATLEKVIVASNTPAEEALTIKGTGSVTYKNLGTGLGVRVSSKDFDNSVMLWSPSRTAGMFCIEHSTELPIFGRQDYFADGGKFEKLYPKDKKTYCITVQPLK